LVVGYGPLNLLMGDSTRLHKLTAEEAARETEYEGGLLETIASLVG
jgi:hypothetical protein